MREAAKPVCSIRKDLLDEVVPMAKPAGQGEMGGMNSPLLLQQTLLIQLPLACLAFTESNTLP